MNKSLKKICKQTIVALFTFIFSVTHLLPEAGASIRTFYQSTPVEGNNPIFVPATSVTRVDRSEEANTQIKKFASGEITLEQFMEWQANAKVLSKSTPEVKQEPAPAIPLALKPETKTEPISEVKPELKPEIKSEPAAEVKLEPKPELKSEPSQSVIPQEAIQAKANPNFYYTLQGRTLVLYQKAGTTVTQKSFTLDSKLDLSRFQANVTPDGKVLVYAASPITIAADGTISYNGDKNNSADFFYGIALTNDAIIKIGEIVTGGSVTINGTPDRTRFLALLSSSQVQSLLEGTQNQISFEWVWQSEKISGHFTRIFFDQPVGNIDGYFRIQLDQGDLVPFALFSKTTGIIRSDVGKVSDFTDELAVKNLMSLLSQLRIQPNHPDAGILISLNRDYTSQFSPEIKRIIAQFVSPVLSSWETYFKTLPPANDVGRTTHDVMRFFISYLFNDDLDGVDPQKMIQQAFDFLKGQDLFSYDFQFQWRSYIDALNGAIQKQNMLLPNDSPIRSWIIQNWARVFDYPAVSKYFASVFNYGFFSTPFLNRSYYGLFTMAAIARKSEDVSLAASELRIPLDKRWDILKDFGIFLLSDAQIAISSQEAESIYGYLSQYDSKLIKDFGVIVKVGNISGEPWAGGMAASGVIYCAQLNPGLFHHEMWHILTLFRSGDNFLTSKGWIGNSLFALGTAEDRPTTYANISAKEDFAEIGMTIMQSTLSQLNRWVEQAQNGRFIGLRSSLLLMEILAYNAGRNQLPIYSNFIKSGAIPVQMDEKQNITMIEVPSEGKKFYFTYSADSLHIQTMTIENTATAERKVYKNPLSPSGLPVPQV
ncbi:MAG: hypothetical protein EXS63_08880 [Candidatus Omnitrophica bacterium]|nr:hypothetical protein [Candidatus Omnitrophota bacterium]